MDTRQRAARALGLGLLATALSACSLFGGGTQNAAHSESAFKLKPGNCLVPPKEVHAELSDVQVVPCTSKHTQEVYALVSYAGDGAAAGSAYPGDAALKKFADGECAQHYQSYVGVDYADSSLFFTYLLPSARSWQADDREVVCIVTTTGAQLTASVKGSRK